MKRLGSVCYWKGLKKDVKELERIWTDISLDFLEGLPTANGKFVILVVVDGLSKYAHFLQLSHPYTAITIAQTFF